jgi:hypothetical protein
LALRLSKTSKIIEKMNSIHHFPALIMHIILNFGNNNARIHSRVLAYFPKEFPEGFSETAEGLIQFCSFTRI